LRYWSDKIQHTRLASATKMVRAMLKCAARHEAHGYVCYIEALSIGLGGFRPRLQLGQRIRILPVGRPAVVAEVVSLSREEARAIGHEHAHGLAIGDRAASSPHNGLSVSNAWLGRVVSPLGAPLDGLGRLPQTAFPRALRSRPPPPGSRQRLGAPVTLGVRALDAFTTIREGQRLGLFAASGIGKSSLLAMLARNGSFDVTVLGLVGERGRELREFVEDDLGPVGLASSIIVCATSDMPPLARREAAYAAMTVAEHFRDAGKRVLLLLDSVTRFALACREIGLASGEPPATRGYPPSVFAELPMLLERAGPGQEGAGSITALMTVLVEGDDHDEPIADAVRGILDGHVVLDRRLAERGHYPPIDVLRSLSRTVPGSQTIEQAALARRARKIIATHADVADLVRLGAYRSGSDTGVDEALRRMPRIDACLQQARGEISTRESAFAMLAEALNDAAT